MLFIVGNADDKIFTLIKHKKHKAVSILELLLHKYLDLLLILIFNIISVF